MIADSSIHRNGYILHRRTPSNFFKYFTIKRSGNLAYQKDRKREISPVTFPLPKEENRKDSVDRDGNSCDVYSLPYVLPEIKERLVRDWTDRIIGNPIGPRNYSNSS